MGVRRMISSVTLRIVGCMLLLGWVSSSAVAAIWTKTIHRDGLNDGVQLDRVEIRGERLPQLSDFAGANVADPIARSHEPGGPVGPGVGTDATKPPSQNNSSKDCSSTKPVLLATGEKWKDETDFTSLGFYGLSQVRTYRSKNAVGRMFGPNWGSSFDYPMLFTAGGCYQDPDSGRCYPREAYITMPDGAKFKYELGDFLTYTVYGAAKTGVMTYTPTAWRLRMDGFTYTYSKFGYLQSISGHSGDGTISFTYSPTDYTRLLKVTNRVGQSITFTWTGNKVTQVVDPAGNTWRYDYNANGMLSRVTSPGSTPDIRDYHYESGAGAWLFTGISINATRYSTYKYFPDGRVQESGLAGGEERDTFVYGSNQTTVANALGQPTVYNFASVNGELRVTTVSRAQTTTCLAAAATTVYDSGGYVDYKLDWNNNKTDLD